MAGPQQREIGSPISTDNESWGGTLNKKADGKSAYKNVQVGGAPTQRNWNPNFYRQSKLGWGPNTEAGEKSAYKNVQVGETGPNIEKYFFFRN
ncbi:TPA: hypothetical protein ACU26D_000515 [Staphylococcus aureus]|uniref:hypothetical protein n=1 Tax=Staphylococcus aureus TaxID=1280 RepID=UPI00077BDA18|nr:hypothetical protein [Staphylococcus aureus]HDA2514205.1 hypothetical protein [Staphylococcus aureus]HDA2708907.1 hypothetical protein [Staphylococcus aureus]HDJ2671657.1 hypothetical protein [Staphylococcus aureus]HDP5860899.1 hypothetical protein [Staphylococcus aureus]HDP5908133.1 hypothetical protein [Staphylococcus aureus]